MSAVSVIGMGKLGAPLAAVLAAAGHEVLGFDSSAVVRKTVTEGRAPVHETGLQDLITQNRSRITMVERAEDAVVGSIASFVVVPTPSGPDGGFICKYVREACETIGAALHKTAKPHLVVICSTVMPQAMDLEIAPALAKAAEMEIGGTLKLCYNPEFIALGSVIHDMRNPDMVLIGESDKAAGDALLEILSLCWENKPYVHRMSFTNAELSKVAVNAFVTMKISFANVLGEMCEALPGGDVDAVSAAIGADSRIGRKYLSSGLGYGGPCFPRDNRAFDRVAQSMTGSPTLASRVDEINDRQATRHTCAILKETQPGDTILILGLSYKPGAAVIEASQAISIAQSLRRSDRTVFVYDDLVSGGSGAIAPHELDDLNCVQDLRKACLSARAIVLALADKTLADRCASYLAERREKVHVFDFWRLLSTCATLGAVDYHGGGLGQAHQARAVS
ncbi:MAG: nucleotide sugar dehydrogenase [Crocosphaera sp.]|nr:nucleotide sugar dehydrogenase [Crocosphaera sp.]MDJ0686557.1 nucleotide sugar dehydrogenase [Alphaproteobacteria bacterium]